MAYALRSERSVLVTSRFESGGRDQVNRMRAWRNGRRDPKREKGKPKRLTGNQQRRTVADAPNGYFSGSLGKRVSKPKLSLGNDQSPAMCRFESCRPHHGSLAQLAEHPVLTRQVEGSTPSRSTNFHVGASSSGRTSRFERENPGSNPGAPATPFDATLTQRPECSPV
jgi:hypothetical protein